jgi:hypothetical protein
LSLPVENFVDQLLYQMTSYGDTLAAPAAKSEQRWERFGGLVSDDLKESASRIFGLVPASVGTVVTTLWRKKAHLKASLFLGDVFQYLDTRGDRDRVGPIVATVGSALRSARDQRSSDDPHLIVIGHSLGGVISYDILTYFDPNLEVDVLVTVGSQVALFEEMGLYKHPPLPANASSERLARPINIKRWLNVMDLNDVFGFRAGGVFEGVTDFEYETGYGAMQSHGGYFHRPSFYRRLGKRLAER